MDDELTGALTSVDVDNSRAQEWFDLVYAAYLGADGNWDEFTSGLAAGAGSEFATAADAFSRYAEDHGKLDMVGRLTAQAQALPSEYAAAKAAASGGTHGVAEPDQPLSPDHAWQEVIQQFGPGFANWDGKTETWPQFRDWVYSAAHSESADWYAAAYEKLQPLDGLQPAERVAKLKEYGFSIAESVSATPKQELTAPAAGTAAPETDVWASVVEQFGPGFANWDGKTETWPQFRDWVYSAANSQSADWYAAAYARFQPLDAVQPAERIAKLKELGFTVNPQPAGAAAATAETEAANVPMEQLIEESLHEALAAVPGAEDLSEDEIAEIRQELANRLAEHAG